MGGGGGGGVSEQYIYIYFVWAPEMGKSRRPIFCSVGVGVKENTPPPLEQKDKLKKWGGGGGVNHKTFAPPLIIMNLSNIQKKKSINSSKIIQDFVKCHVRIMIQIK